MRWIPATCPAIRLSLDFTCLRAWAFIACDNIPQEGISKIPDLQFRQNPHPGSRNIGGDKWDAGQGEFHLVEGVIPCVLPNNALYESRSMCYTKHVHR